MTDISATFSGSIPDYYDRCLGPAWFEAFAEDLAQRLPARPPGDVLEIACGSGIVTRRLRRRLDPAVRLVASDLSKAMLDYARAKSPGESVEWREADACRLPFRDGEFGAAVCGFGVMFVPDRGVAFREVRRVLTEGGVFLFNVWDRIEENPHALVNAQVTEDLFPGDAEMRFRAPFEMYDPSLLRGLLADHGFRETRIEKTRIPISGIDARTIALGVVRGTPRSLLLEKRGANLDDVVERTARELAKIGGTPYCAHAQAIVVEAQAIA